MTLSATLLAETQQAATGGTGWFLPVMLVVMVLLLWLPMRRQKKAQAQMKAKQSTMGPGTRVMTSFGLYGTVVEIDRDENRAVLEVAPGTRVTVHLQTVNTVIDEPAAATPAPVSEDGTATAAVPQDLSGPAQPGEGATAVDPEEPLSGPAQRPWDPERRDHPPA